MKHVFIAAVATWLAACSPPNQKLEVKTEVAQPLFKVDSTTAGTVSGNAAFAGRKPAAKRIDIGEDEECVRLNKRGLFDEAVLVTRSGALSNVFVYIKTGFEGKAFERPARTVVLDQKGCQYVPRVFGVRTGQTFQVTNSDPVTHNVHPIAKMNREWNQSQAPGDPPLERKFVRPEVLIRVKCNVHSWMRSWVAAMEHPYFAVTGADGAFAIPNVPPGDYTLEAWHEALGTKEQRIHIDPSGKSTTTFTFKAEPNTR